MSVFSRLKHKMFKLYYGIEAPCDAVNSVVRCLRKKPVLGRLFKRDWSIQEYASSTLACGGGGIVFFTYANLKYHVFAALYPIFVLATNDSACVEICLSEFEVFKEKYQNIIDFYDRAYPGRVLYRGVRTSGVFQNSVRFLIQPRTVRKYVYIGDIDIMILDKNIADYHKQFMEKYSCDFSNVLRNEHQLTGLHFIEYEKMYPGKIPEGTDLMTENDEVLLCSLMREKHMRFPPPGVPLSERKTHGLHMSLNRPPLLSLTTKDNDTDFPSWSLNPDSERYFEVRYSAPVIEFTQCIETMQLQLRQVIQVMDMYAYYRLHEKL